MANKLRGEVTLKLKGRNYTLRPTFEALCMLEEQSNTSVLLLMSKMEGCRIRVKDLSLLVWAGILGADPDSKLTMNQVGQMILDEGLISVIEQRNDGDTNPISQFLMIGILGGEIMEDVEAGKKPPENPRKKKKKPS